MANQGRAPERARRDFLEHGFAGDRFDLIDDVVTAPKAIQLFGVMVARFLVSRRKAQGSTATPSMPVT